MEPDTKLWDLTHSLDTRVTVLEGWRKSLSEDMRQAVSHQLEIDRACADIQEYLEQRKDSRRKQDALIQDAKRWAILLALGWLLVTFGDGLKHRVTVWLQPQDSTSTAR